MKADRVRLISGLGTAALCAAFASSCSTPLQMPSDASASATHTSPALAGRIAQIDFGREASFAQCLPPACPAVTPKTLAVEAPYASVTVHAIEPAASLSAGEAIVASDPDALPPAQPVAAMNDAPAAAPATRQVTVHFEFGDATLSPAARELIDQVAQPLASVRRIAISGRTDSVGPQQINEALALDRANAVRAHLRARYPQLEPEVTLDAQGACCFAASNDTAQGRALNRRVEVTFERDVEDE